jgi:hypothetical protein
MAGDIHGNTMIILDKFVISTTEPEYKGVIWYEPKSDKLMIYLNETWTQIAGNADWLKTHIVDFNIHVEEFNTHKVDYDTLLANYQELLNTVNQLKSRFDIFDQSVSDEL